MSGLRDEIRKERNQDMANMYMAGNTLQTIADKYGCTREYVRQCLEKFGLKRRNKKGERASLTNNVKINSDVATKKVIEDLEKQVEHYKKECRRHQQEKLTMKKYYKEKLLSEFLK